jgi:hypothetical protein
MCANFGFAALGEIAAAVRAAPAEPVSTQSRQNVHSNVQIIASAASGGRSLSQHSQLGRSSSMVPP